MRTLRGYLAVLVLGALLPGLLVAAVLVRGAFADNRAAVERRLLESARVDARSLDSYFDTITTTLRALATSPALQSGDLAAFHAEGRRIQISQDGWYSVLLLSKDEQQLVSTRLPWGTPLTAAVEPESLRRAVASQGAVVGTIRQTPVQDPKLVFAVRLPVMRDGKVQYVLSALVDARTLRRVQPPLDPDGDEWTRTIVDPAGTIAARTRGEEFVGQRSTPAFLEYITQHAAGVSNQVTPEGIPVYAATTRSAAGWTTAVIVPRQVLDRPGRDSLTGIILGGALLVGCGLIAVLLMTRRIAREIDSVGVVAAAVAQRQPPPPYSPGLRETARVQQSLTETMTMLEQQARSLQAEVQRADTARSEAEEASRAKDEFLAVLGHELRNPLAPALTALELMKSRDAAVFPRERQILERQVGHMIRLVNDLLDVSRLARGKVEISRRRIDLGDVISRAVDMTDPLMRQRGHELTVKVANGIDVVGDLDRLVQVFGNLLANAARYTPERGRVWLSATVAANRAVVECEDDGPGIPPPLRPTLFQAFTQGPRGRDRSEGGLGLGLALARVFTELHDGTISLEPARFAGGARFVVTLPLAAATFEDTAAPTDEREEGARAITSTRLLVVDDNADALDMLQTMLSDAGHTVHVASDALSALNAAAQFRPDVAILDLGLPGIDGFELARRLKASYPDIHLIAVSGYAQARDREEARAAGFVAHFAKPASRSSLLTAVDQALRGAG